MEPLKNGMHVTSRAYILNYDQVAHQHTETAVSAVLHSASAAASCSSHTKRHKEGQHTAIVGHLRSYICMVGMRSGEMHWRPFWFGVGSCFRFFCEAVHPRLVCCWGSWVPSPPSFFTPWSLGSSFPFGDCFGLWQLGFL